MPSYVRQGEVGRTTLLRMFYVLIVYVVIGGIQALIPFSIILLEAGDVSENRLKLTAGEGPGMSSTLQEVSPEVLGWAIGAASLMLLLILAMSVRMFHRRTFRSVWAGAGIRWRRWGQAALGAAAVVLTVAMLGGIAGDRSIGSSLFLAFGLIGTVVQAVSVEAFRGYLMQSLVARGGHWRVKGTAVTPFLVAVGFLTPGIVLLYLLGELGIAQIPMSVIALYLTGCVLVPGLLILLDEGLERAVGVQAAVRGGAFLMVCLGVPGLTGWAWGASALLVVFGGVTLRNERIRTPLRLWARLRRMLMRDARVSLTEKVESEGTCRNCGTPLVGRYCHRCGQRHRTEKPSITMVAERIVDSVFEVDSRILRTLRLLFLRPGALSAHYFAGRRADFIPPIRLYLVASVIFFLPLAALIPDITESEDDDSVYIQVPRSTLDSLANETLTPEDAVRQARYTGTAALDSFPRPVETEVEEAYRSPESFDEPFPDAVAERIDVYDLGSDSLIVLSVSGLPDAMRDAVADKETVDLTVQVRRSTLDSLTAEQLTPEEVVQRALFFGDAATDSLPPAPAGASTSDLANIEGTVPSFVKQRVEVEEVRGDSLAVLEISDIPGDVYRASVPPEVRAEHDEEEKEGRTALQTALQNLGQVMFLLMPLFALILSMVYLNEPYAHHIIFSLHVHSFAFCIIGAQLILELLSLPSDVLVLGRFVAGGAVLGYLIAAMRRAYGSGWLRTVGIVVLTLMIYMIIAGIVFGSTVGLIQEIGDWLPQGFL